MPQGCVTANPTAVPMNGAVHGVAATVASAAGEEGAGVAPAGRQALAQAGESRRRRASTPESTSAMVNRT